MVIQTLNTTSKKSELIDLLSRVDFDVLPDNDVRDIGREAVEACITENELGQHHAGQCVVNEHFMHGYIGAMKGPCIDRIVRCIFHYHESYDVDRGADPDNQGIQDDLRGNLENLDLVTLETILSALRVGELTD